MLLRAGPLTMMFEPRTGFLRHIRLGDHEVVRAIYAAVRDQNWGTVPPRLGQLQCDLAEKSFRLSFEVRCLQPGIDYVWKGTVSGDEAGRVFYTFEGETRSGFLRNRIGLCVLHPAAECAGRPCLVEHSDGKLEQGAFPKLILPDQPFFDVRAVTYEIAGTTAEIRLAGDEFEMEDQRNWSDASFKTYCTPQSRPKPAPVEPGDKVHQSATLSLQGPVRPVLPVIFGRPPQLSISTTPVRPLPPIGLCVARHGQAWTPAETERLKALKLSHLRVDLRLATGDYVGLLAEAAAQADQLGAGLQVGLTVSDNAAEELEAFSRHLERAPMRVSLWLIFHETEPAAGERWVQLARRILQKHGPDVLFAAGTLDFFTEVNRNKPGPDSTAFPVYSNNPQVHAFDNLTMVENLAGQSWNVESARAFSAKPVVVAPITLKIRSKWDNGAPCGTELPEDVDPRQMSLFGAGWTLGSLARLAAVGGVHSLSYYETTGWRGVMETSQRSPLPEKFPSWAGCVFPMYHVFADLGECSGRQVQPTHSSHPLLMEGLTLVDPSGRRRILVANFTGEIQETKIESGPCRARIRYLDETNVELAMREPEAFRAQSGVAAESVGGKIELRLLPFALARVDIE